MSDADSFREREFECELFARELFMRPEYYPWVKQLSARRTNRWYSLIVTLDETGADLTEIKSLGEDIYRIFVFDVTRSPTFKTSGDYIIRFSLAGRMWNTTIWHIPAPYHDI
ncbi:MAG: hypothetical protein AAF662_01475 [Pseudomonadota bacterium]